MEFPTLQLSDKVKMTVLSDGGFKLDAGSVFGIIPKPLWEKRFKADQTNRFPIALNIVLIQDGGVNMIIDCGIGPKAKYSPKLQEIYGIEQPPDLMETLKAVGLSSADIHYILFTHLHFDHAGWATTPDASGKLAITFPNAKCVVQRTEWAAANDVTDRTAGSYNKDFYLPLAEHGKLMIVDGDHQVTPSVKVMHTSGHTEGHQSVMVEAGGRKAFYWGDIMPSTMHIDVPYISAYDLLPNETAKAKKRLLAQALAEGWTSFFSHDTRTKFGVIRLVEKKYVV